MLAGSEYLPLSHDVHELAPAALAYLPLSLSLTLSLSLSLPATQDTHAAAPVESW